MPGNERPLLLLFDGNALVHRAFHALPPLTVSGTGEMVNAVYGFAATLLKVLAELKPRYWAIAFDTPAPTFRHRMFKEYKAQRPPAPEELIGQIKRIHQLVNAFSIPTYEVDGFEADDVLGTLSRQSSELNIETIIVTGDNDMLQAVHPGVRILSPKRSFAETVLYDEAAVREKYGVRPEQITDFKALVGDNSDNIPGIPGIGEKTATRLIQQYQRLEEIYARIGEIAPEKLRAALQQHQPQALRCRELVTIVNDAPVSLNLDACEVSHYDRREVVKLFQELEFNRLLQRLPQTAQGSTAFSPPTAMSQGSCQMVTTESALNQLISQVGSSTELVVNLITALPTSRLTRGRGFQGEGLPGGVVGIGLSPAREGAFYIPLGHFGLNQPEQLPLPRVVATLKPILESSRTGKIAHDGKGLMTVLAEYGVKLEGLVFDITIAAHLLGEKNLELKTLAFNRLGTETPALGELADAGKKQVSPALLRADQVADYACSSARVAWNLRGTFRDELNQYGLWQLYSEVEVPLIPVLADMERNGISLDIAFLRKMSLELGQEMLKREAQIYDAVGHRFNINSPRQLGQVLFGELGLPGCRKTKNGYSTEASILEGLREQFPVVGLVLEYRQLGKLKSTYVDALPALVNPDTARVHTVFNQTGTTTGRLSSSDPNLQNIPVRTELGRGIRRAIKSPPGACLLSADYSQIDLRALAHLSRDPDLIAAFARNEDIHTMTASRVFSVAPDQVTPDMRRAAKVVNFGIIYGMSDYGLEQATDFSRDQAARFITLYFERYPKVAEYIEKTKAQARDLGYVQTVMGRRRFIPEVNSSNRQLREAAERMAINAPVQGTSADIIKVAMVRLHQQMVRQRLRSKMLLQIHDELIFEVPDDEVQQMTSLVSRLMPQALKLAVPLKVDIKIGDNWGDMRQVTAAS